MTNADEPANTATQPLCIICGHTETICDWNRLFEAHTTLNTHQFQPAPELNETPTEPGYFYDKFGRHTYMGRQSKGKPELEPPPDTATTDDLDGYGLDQPESTP